ncbi:MAG TPA: hypothetical protein VFN77_10370 [Acetobacteraceae bacterium]|nr:hypothetical protein [Acetobacteraceae bacterium]
MGQPIMIRGSFGRKRENRLAARSPAASSTATQEILIPNIQYGEAS